MLSFEEMGAVVDETKRTIEDMSRKILKLELAASLASSAMNEAAEYFDDLADADCDQDGFIPNREMRLHQEVEEAIRALEAAVK
jgi:hypothetical protein